MQKTKSLLSQSKTVTDQSLGQNSAKVFSYQFLRKKLAWFGFFIKIIIFFSGVKDFTITLYNQEISVNFRNYRLIKKEGKNIK